MDHVCLFEHHEKGTSITEHGRIIQVFQKHFDKQVTPIDSKVIVTDNDVIVNCLSICL